MLELFHNALGVAMGSFLLAVKGMWSSELESNRIPRCLEVIYVSAESVNLFQSCLMSDELTVF